MMRKLVQYEVINVKKGTTPIDLSSEEVIIDWEWNSAYFVLFFIATTLILNDIATRRALADLGDAVNVAAEF